MGRPALLLFAKTPEPGRVKTRLVPPLTPRQAAAVAEWLIRRSVALASAHWPGPLEVHAWPDAGAPLWRELAASGLRVHRQAPGGLGAKMHRALKYAIARYGAAAVMGCDLPHCPPSVLRAAARTLAAGREVIGPAADGGYYLIGLTRPRAAPFTGLAWGTPWLYVRTLGRLRAGGRRPRVLPVLRDLDTWSDVQAVAADWPALGRAIADLAGVEPAPRWARPDVEKAVPAAPDKGFFR